MLTNCEKATFKMKESTNSTKPFQKVLKSENSNTFTIYATSVELLQDLKEDGYFTRTTSSH